MNRSDAPPLPSGLDLRAIVVLLARELAPLVAEELARVAPPMAPSPSPMVAKQEAARHFNVSTATLDRLCRTGEIPYVTIGDSRRFDLAAVRAALEARAGAEPKAPPVSSPPETSTGVRRVSRGAR